MKRFNIIIYGPYPYSKTYCPDGEFVDAEIAVDLLEALQMLLEFPNTGPATSAALAAIAKAKVKGKNND